jgi:hypothetical protein
VEPNSDDCNNKNKKKKKESGMGWGGNHHKDLIGDQQTQTRHSHHDHRPEPTDWRRHSTKGQPLLGTWRAGGLLIKGLGIDTAEVAGAAQETARAKSVLAG